MVLPINSVADAVESFLKVTRKWSVEANGVPESRAHIILADNNFHGWMIRGVSFSSDPVMRRRVGSFTSGFCSVILRF